MLREEPFSTKWFAVAVTVAVTAVPERKKNKETASNS
jgi:hypothetical protein